MLCAKAWADTPPWQAFVTEASERFRIPETWIMAVIQAESAGQVMLNGEPITSPAGAMGLMQVMPKTYADLRTRYGFGTDPYDPHDNILAGTAYLAEMYRRYGYPWCFAAYNAGPARLDEYLQKRRALPNETISYLVDIETALNTVTDRPVFHDEQMASKPSHSDKIAARSALFFMLGEANLGSTIARKTPSQWISQRLFMPLGSTLPKNNSPRSTEP